MVLTTSEAVELTGGVVVRDHTINIGQSSASPIAHWEARGAMDGPDARAQSVPRWTTLRHLAPPGPKFSSDPRPTGAGTPYGRTPTAALRAAVVAVTQSLCNYESPELEPVLCSGSVASACRRAMLAVKENDFSSFSKRKQ